MDGGGAAVHSTYGPSAFPTVVLIGPDGNFKNIDIWPISSVTSIETAVSNAGGGSVLAEHSCALNISELTIDAGPLFPNPVKDNATIRVSAPNTEIAELNIYSIAGELISTKTCKPEGGSDSLTVNFSALQPGTYFVQLKNSTSFSPMIPVVKQ